MISVLKTRAFDNHLPAFVRSSDDLLSRSGSLGEGPHGCLHWLETPVAREASQSAAVSLSPPTSQERADDAFAWPASGTQAWPDSTCRTRAFGSRHRGCFQLGGHRRGHHVGGFERLAMCGAPSDDAAE